MKYNTPQRLKGQKINLTQQIIDEANALNRPDLIHLSIGVPDGPINPYLKRAVAAALNAGKTEYTTTAGIPELRDEISKKYRNFSKKENVLVTAGSSEAVFLIMAGLVNPGDEVIVISPSYFIYSQGTKFCGGKVVEVPLDTVNGRFSLDTKKVDRAVTKNTKLIVLNSPHNPTGWVADQKTVKELVKIAEKHKIFLLSDEIYKDFIYSGKFVSPERLSKRVIVVDGISKIYSATGLRLGWIVADSRFISRISPLHQLIIFSAPTPVQYGVLNLLKKNEKGWISKYVQQMRKKRDLAIRELSKRGIEIIKPDGAFYLFVRLKSEMSGKKFAENLLRKQNVTVVPGEDYGKKWKNYFRVAYCKNKKDLAEGCDRISAAV